MSNYTDGLPEIFRSSVEGMYGFLKQPFMDSMDAASDVFVKGRVSGENPVVTAGKVAQTFIPYRVSQATEVSSPAEPALDPAAPPLEPTNTTSPPIGGGPTAPGLDPRNTTTQLGDLVNVFDKYLGGQQGYLDKITDPQYLEAQSALRQRELANATRLIADAQMGQMKEKTRRDTIDAWRQITSDQIRAQTALAQGLMEASYRSATPNAATIQALAPLSQQAMSVFKPGTSVI